MVNMQNLSTSFALLVSSLLFATSSSALHIGARQADANPTPIAHLSNVAAAAVITPGPSLDFLGDLKFARAALPTIPVCADSCIASAVTKSTDCKLGDTVCECNWATVINNGAAACVQSACGYLGAVQAQLAGEDLCLSVLAGAGSTPTNNNNNVPSKSVAPINPTGSSSGGSSGGPSGGSSGGSDGGSDDGSSGSSNSGGSSSSSLHSKPNKRISKGAIAGIVVGVVVGISAAAAAIWKFCLTKMKGGSSAAAGVDGTTTDASPASGAPVETAQVFPVDPAKITSTTTISTPSELSNNPQTVSSISPFQGSTTTSPVYPTTTSPVYPTTTSPVYPNAAELPNGSWPQQHPAEYTYPPHPMGQAYHEVHAPPPEMAGDTHIVQELHGGGQVYEM